MTQEEIQNIKRRFEIIGQSPLLNRDIEIAVQVAKTDLSVLVTGESGVGKEHFPKIIHQYSARKHGPYFAINCGAIPEGTIDSELFGHEKGAFTDAKAERRGYFEIADGGTLFLDEVGELPLQTQVRLLRVLETGEFIRMGSSTVQKTNVRVVAATNLNMRRAIQEGKFREDLYYRLNTVEIRVPALRERKDDIPLLFRKFAVDFSTRYHMPPLSLSDEASQLLKAYYWNGNIRQLKNIAEQISVIEVDHQISAETLSRYLPRNEAESGIVLAKESTDHIGQDYSGQMSILYKMVVQLRQEVNHLQQQLHQQQIHSQSGAVLPEPDKRQPFISETIEDNEAEVLEVEEVSENENLETGSRNQEPGTREQEPGNREQEPGNREQAQSLEQMTRQRISQALKDAGNNRKVAAAQLGISERTLYRKIKEYGL